MNTNADIEAIKSLIAARETAIANADAEVAIEPFARDVVVYDLQPPLAFTGADGDLGIAYGLSHMQGEKIEEGAVELKKTVTRKR